MDNDPSVSAKLLAILQQHSEARSVVDCMLVCAARWILNADELRRISSCTAFTSVARCSGDPYE